MSAAERQKQFREAVERLSSTLSGARIAENFGFSNSSRVLEGGLFACTNNIESYSKKLMDGTAVPVPQFVFLCVLTFPPQDEVYFAIVVEAASRQVDTALTKLGRVVEARNATLAAAGKTAGKINNNAKFYVTSSGNLYVDNEFLNEVQESRLDPDCLARVDRVIFSIWPPAVSARRSLLAREFVGYLGSLVGAEKIHEITVWPDAAALGPEMRRMPPAIPADEIEKAVGDLGGWYPGGEIRRYHAALNFLASKHFVILAGLSGTGKTRLALQYAMAVHGVTSDEVTDPLLVVCPVRPEWTDPTGLTGYYDVLSNRYMVPPFLEAVLIATAHRESPVFVILDEMNLARVEYYFSDVLSCIETRRPLQLHSSGVPLEGSTGTSIPAALPLPPNLFITGTINIDETTNPVSDKVLDRAVVIDMSRVDLSGFFDSLAARVPELAASVDTVRPRLLAVHELLVRNGQGFGYRVAEEVVRYHAFSAIHGTAGSEDTIDELMVSKVLVKLRGTERQRQLLSGLSKALGGLPASGRLLERLTGDLEEFGSFQAAR